MDPREQHLKVLGLRPDATWNEVNQTYKDLMRVWHPDRFQNDERLRKKAEEQSQQINHAMSELRKLEKEPAKPKPSPKAPQQPRTEKQRSTQAHASSKDNFSNASFHFGIAPLLVRQRPVTSLMRIAGASVILWLAFESMIRPSYDRYQCAFAAGLLFCSLDVGIKNLLLLVFPKPLVSVDRRGLFCLKTGRLNWIDFDQVWPTMSARATALHIVFSKHYIAKQPLLLRVLLYLRSLFRTAHATVGFSGLNSNAVQVINAMKLQKMHEDVVLEEIQRTATGRLFVAQLVCVVCALTVIVRCLTRIEITPLDWIPYVGLFVLCRTGEFVTRLLRGP